MNPPVLPARELLTAAMTGVAGVFAAEVVNVHDGDTFTADIKVGATVYGADRPLGFGLAVKNKRLYLRAKVRLAGCNAAELGTPGGNAAEAHMAAILPVGTLLELSGVKIDDYGGRWDCAVKMPDGADLTTALIAEQWVAPWDGRRLPKPVPPWPRTVG